MLETLHKISTSAASIPYAQALPLVAFLVSVWELFSYLRIYQRWRFLPPGPQGIPLIGNWFQIQSGRPWQLLTSWGEQFGPIYSLTIFGQPIIVLNTTEAATDLFVRKASQYSSRPRSIMGGELMTRGQVMLFTPFGPQFNRFRRASHEGLNARAVKNYLLIQEREANLLTLNLMKDPSRLLGELQRTTASVIISVVYGWKPIQDTNHPTIEEIIDVLHSVEISALPGAYLIDVLPFLLRIPEFLSTWKQKGERWYSEKTLLFERLIDEVKANRDRLPDCIAMGLLDRVDSGELSRSEAAWLAGTIFAGGTEPVARAMAIFLLEICLNPSVMRRAQEEIDKVVGRERMPSFEDYDRLPYITAIVRELSRHNPVSFIGMPRQCTEDDWYMGHYIPKGSVVLSNIWGMQRDPRIYPDPDVFRPERFLDESGSLKPAMADTNGLGHVSFGFGKRICPGMHLASQALFIDIASMLWAFDIENPTDLSGKPIRRLQDTVVQNGVVMQPLPFDCEFKPRSPEVKTLVEQELARRT